jgi:cephalosporin hydroxylase
MTPNNEPLIVQELSPHEAFLAEVKQNIEGLREDTDVQALSRIWLREITRHKYAYNFSWMGRPIIQLPQDMLAMQEIIWNLKPDLIIETGIAHGGSLIYYASLLELVNLETEPENLQATPGVRPYVLGIDIDIRAHNLAAIQQHTMYQRKRIQLIEGSSISEEVFAQVRQHAENKRNIVVVLDSNHTHEHVLQELNFYSSFIKQGGYLIVFDTVIEAMPDDLLHTQNRPWKKGDNPQTAVQAFLTQNDRFQPDWDLEAKLLITVAPMGYLKCIKA